MVYSLIMGHKQPKVILKLEPTIHGMFRATYGCRWSERVCPLEACARACYELRVRYGAWRRQRRKNPKLLDSKRLTFRYGMDERSQWEIWMNQSDEESTTCRYSAWDASRGIVDSGTVAKNCARALKNH